MSKAKALKEAKEFFKLNPLIDPSQTAFFTSEYPEVCQLAIKQKARLEGEAGRLNGLLSLEKNLWSKGVMLVAGVDEVGRGPLAGPVVAAAVILAPQNQADLAFWGLNDSKKLTEQKRYELEAVIKSKAVAWAIAWQNHRQIDRDGIAKATYQAMLKALEKLSQRPEFVLVDGPTPIPLDIAQKAVVKGDSLSLSIAAASVLAKCCRDRWMDSFALRFPEYAFEKNKGYGSGEHISALQEYGPCLMHRNSFKLKPQIKDDRVAKGRKGEDLAVRELEKQGFEIVQRNYLRKTGEIDIIALKAGKIYFVEVRSKSSAKYGTAAESINKSKKAKIRKTAEHYFWEKGHVYDSIFLFAFVDLKAFKVDFVEDMLL